VSGLDDVRLGARDHEDCLRIIHHALDAGINFIDTADVYSAGESEEIVGKALRGRRDDIIVATKSYFSVQEGPAVSRPRLNSSGSSRRHLVRACEDSLQRLGTDWIDLYQVHRIDYATDIDDTLGALSDLVHAGKIRAIGTSSFNAARIVEAQWTSERRNRERFACEQPQYSMFVREIEQEVLSTCQRFGMGVIVWSPLNAGWLSGARRRSSGSDGIATRRARLMPHLFDVDDAGSSYKFDLLEELERLAAQSIWSAPASTGAGLRPRTSRGHLRDHRTAHPRTPRGPTRSRGGHIADRGTRPYRRVDPARHQRQPRQRSEKRALAFRRQTTSTQRRQWLATALVNVNLDDTT
jgi:aryl-alcohol dehydrogenase-like predicted oxidoreductase